MQPGHKVRYIMYSGIGTDGITYGDLFNKFNIFSILKYIIKIIYDLTECYKCRLPGKIVARTGVNQINTVHLN